MPIPIETPRLLLRPLAPADRDALAAYRSDPGVARHQSWDSPYSAAQAEDLIAEMAAATPGQAGEWYQLGVGLLPGGELIGDCVFHIRLDEPRQAEIGYTLAPAHQGRGYGAEAVGALLGYLFGELGMHRVRANCIAGNLASARLLERVGMRREAHHIESTWFKGRWESELWYAVLAREWESGRAGERESGRG